MDDRRRMAELRNGLVCHAGVRPVDADACDEEVDRTLGAAARARSTWRR